MRSNIKQLPQAVISAIAAGEVAERPSLIVKELIENALDAAASTIEVTVYEAGLKSIQVYDDGKGMSADDLKVCVQRHTTSKIKSLRDLEHIKTLGFRGEALASIASVGKLTIQSKAFGQNNGHSVTVIQEQPGKVTPVGIPRGTTVLVEDVYQDIPVRKKFLKNTQTELRHIVNNVVKAALSHPDTAFSLVHNKKRLLNFPRNQELLARLVSLFQPEIIDQLVPVSLQRSYFSLEGFIGKPQLARKNKNKQYLFLNQRSITSPSISKQIKEAFGSLIEPQAEPFFVLYLSLPASVCDVNVHPRKETASFMDEAQVLELVKIAIRESLDSAQIQYQNVPPAHQVLSFADSDKSALGPLVSSLKKAVEPWSTKQLTTSDTILQIDNTYLVLTKEDGLTIIDQHAAHERILFDQFATAFEQENVELENKLLDDPVALTLDEADAQILSEHQENLQTLGFYFEEFGGHTYKLTHIPEYLEPDQAKKVISELLDDLAEGKEVGNLTSLTKRTLAYLACRSAVMAGDPLTEQERKNLVEKLAKTNNKFTCPHGRPTMVSFSINDLEKMFKRR